MSEINPAFGFEIKDNFCQGKSETTKALYLAGMNKINPAFSFKEIKEEVNPYILYRYIESYLGEYRFKLPIYHYHLQLRGGNLVDPLTQEPMIDKAKRALEKRISLGLSSQREEAELQSLDYLGKNLKPLDTLIWVSPPGKKKDGYGSYGFFFYGFVNNNGDIEMTARRAEMTEEEFKKEDFSRFSQALYQITNNPQFLNMKTDIDFLSSPIILRLGEGTVDIEKNIESHFGEIDLEILNFFSQQIKSLRPIINHFIEVYFEGKEDNSYLISLFNTIENLALLEDISHQDFDYRLIPLDRLIQHFGYTPPQVFGSCGSTISNQNQSLIEKLTKLPFSTPNILEKLRLFSDDEDEYGSLSFHCPVCNGEHTRPRGKLLTHCPKTGEEIPKC